MFKALRVSVLLLILVFVALNAWLSHARSTDWNNSLWIKIYPINGDGSETSERYINSLGVAAFQDIEQFMAEQTERYGHKLDRAVRIELGHEIHEQPPALGKDPNVLDVMIWSLRMRYWANRVGSDQDRIEPDIRLFVRYYAPKEELMLDDSVGMQKGMYGIVNVFASHRYEGPNDVIIAHEFLHTLGATDKYARGSGQPIAPDGLAEPDKRPLYPQRKAEIMAGRIALAADDAVIPQRLSYALIGPKTATEIGLRE